MKKKLQYQPFVIAYSATFPRISKTLLFLILTIFFFASVAIVNAQSTCANATTIPSLPYNQTGLSNCGNGDSYSGTPACLNPTYFKGEDYVLKYTPSANQCVNLSVNITTPGNSPWNSGVAVLNACPTSVGAACLGSSTGNYQVKNHTVNNISLVAGTTYYIIVSGGQNLMNSAPYDCMAFNITMSDCQAPCIAAPIISSLPYNQTGLTNCGQGNSFSGTPACLNPTYFDGEDYIMKYTPTANQCVNMKASFTTSPWSSGMAVLNNCPATSGATCVASITGTVSATSLTLTNVNLVAGTTYYILVSGGQNSSPSPPNACMGFDFQLSECPIPPPPLPTTPQGVECGNNLGFEDGDLNGWTGYTGTGALGNCCIPNATTPGLVPGVNSVNGSLGTCGNGSSTAAGVGSRHTRTTGTGTDPNTDNVVPVVAPGCRTSSVRIGNQEPGFEAECMEKTFLVTTSNVLFTYLYAVVLQNPANHTTATQPRFEISIKNSSGSLVSCGGLYDVTADNALAEGFVNATSPPCGAPDVWYKNWTAVGTDLTPYLGQNVTIRFCTGDCGQGGHFGYAYVDTYCKPKEITGTKVCSTGGAVTLTAPGGFTNYVWSPGGATGQSISVSNPVDGTVYTVQFESIVGSGCVSSVTDTIKLITANAGTDTTICSGATGNMILHSSSNDLSATYAWTSSPAGFTSSLPNPTITLPTTTTTYSVVVSSSLGCSITKTVTVTLTPKPPATASANNPCIGSAINLTSTGGTIWSWSGPNYTSTSQNPVINSSTTAMSGTYTVTVSTGGCSNTATVNVTVDTIPVVNVPNVSICPGGSTPLTASGASTYAWSPGTGLSATTGTTVTANPSVTTTYTVTGTTTGGCTGSTTVTVTIGTLIADAGPNATICPGSSATLSASGGSIFSWSPATGLSSTTIFNPVATPTTTTTYTVTVSSGSCTDTDVVTVTVIPNPIISVPSTSICPGGSASLTASGANTYTWSPNTGLSSTSGTTVTANPTATTTYTVTGTTTGACTGSTTVTVSVNSSLVIDAGPNDSICSGGNVPLSATQITGGTYSWSPATGLSNTNTYNPIATPTVTTTYTVNVTDPGGCTGLDSIKITVDPPITLNIAGFPPNCAGGNDGQAVVIPSGGFGGYTYQWAPVTGTTASVNGPAGTYTVTVTDLLGCVTSASTVVTDPTPITGTTSVVAANCNQADGSATVATVSGGAGSYTYSWNTTPVQTTQTASNISANTYTVTITDFNGCIATLSATVPNVGSITASIPTSTDVSCNGGNNGSATSLGTGGALPYSYMWSNSQATPGISNLIAGSYSVTITDVNGCSATANVIITEPTPVVVTSANASICPNSSASLSATGTGGTGTINFSWNPGALTGSNVSVSPSATTIYTITGTDANNCTGSTTVTVTVNPIPVIGVTNATICTGSSTTLTASGAVSYAWASSTGLSSTAGTTVTANPTVTTTYTVTGTNTTGCTGSAPVTVTVNPAPVITVPNASICPGEDTTLTASGAVSYSWSPSSTLNVSTGASVIATPYATTIYTVTGTNSFGCTASASSTVTVNPKPVASFTASPNPASIFSPTITFTDQTYGAVAWNWNLGNVNTVSNTGVTSPNTSFTYPDTGYYQVELIVTNQFGCIDTAALTVYIKGEYTFFIPNTFTPNDDGVNDMFAPKGTGIAEDDYDLWIFDRWGNLIWHTDTWGKAWDGRANHGDDVAQIDTYVWKVHVKEKDTGIKHRYLGHVNIVK